MSPARLMFRRILRFPGLPCLPNKVDEVAAGLDKQARKVSAKESRNTKVSKYGRSVVELEEGLLQDQKKNFSTLKRLFPESVRVAEAPMFKERTEAGGSPPS
jgi:hypothetical protein